MSYYYIPPSMAPIQKLTVLIAGGIQPKRNVHVLLVGMQMV